MSGDEVDTDAGGRVLLSASSGEQLRLDRQSVSQWTSRNELHLTAGAVYVETALASSIRPLIVSTQLGDVRHVGTRFEVRVADGETRVRVRDGKVSFAPTGGSLIAVDAGQQLVARSDTSVVGTGPASAAPEWHWTMDIAPAFTLEGRSAFDALQWLGHEAGLDVRYTTGHAQAQARATTLRGSIDGLDAQSALRAVLAGSGLAFELYPDRIEVRSSDAG
jgi:transmembrane sensor